MAAKTTRRSEQVAIHVLERIYSSANVKFRDSQCNGEYDIDVRGEGVHAAIEVTASAREDSIRTLDKIAKEKTYVAATLCKSSWLIHFRPDVRIRKAVQTVDGYLSAIEADGIEHFFEGSHPETSSVSSALTDLGISVGSALRLPAPARIWLGGPSDGCGSIVNGQDLQSAVKLEAWKQDNRKKLAMSGCAQRHLFVYVDPTNEHAWQAMVCRTLPEEPLLLPAEITHAWVAAESPDGIIVWAAESGGKWRELGVFEPLQRSPVDGSVQNSGTAPTGGSGIQTPFG